MKKGYTIKTRMVYYCPSCGWESFSEYDYWKDCGQTGCKGKISAWREEEYEV